MDEIQKLLPLISFLSAMCTAVTVAILLKANIERIALDTKEMKEDWIAKHAELIKEVYNLRERLLKQETICDLHHEEEKQNYKPNHYD